MSVVKIKPTRMFFSEKCTICITHRSPNIYHKWTFLSFKLDMTFPLNDIDLQMTLNFDWYLVEYKHTAEIDEI